VGCNVRVRYAAEIGRYLFSEQVLFGDSARGDQTPTRPMQQPPNQISSSEPVYPGAHLSTVAQHIVQPILCVKLHLNGQTETSGRPFVRLFVVFVRWCSSLLGPPFLI